MFSLLINVRNKAALNIIDAASRKLRQNFKRAKSRAKKSRQLQSLKVL